MQALRKDCSIRKLYYIISAVEKNVFDWNWNFVFLLVKFNYKNYLSSFQLLFWDVTQLPISDNISEQLKVEVKREGFSSYNNYIFWDELNISQEEHVALKVYPQIKTLSFNNCINVNLMVLLNRNDYIKPINKMLSDSRKFNKRCTKPGKEINSLLQQEERLTNFFKDWKRSISD